MLTYIYIYLSTLSICMEERFNISYIYIHNDKQIYSPNLPNGKKHGFSQVNCFARCITPHLVFWQSLSPRGIYLENLLGRHPISGTPNPSLGYVFEGETCSLNLQIIKEGLDSLSDNFSWSKGSSLAFFVKSQRSAGLMVSSRFAEFSLLWHGSGWPAESFGPVAQFSTASGWVLCMIRT